MPEWTDREIRLRGEALAAADSKRQEAGGHFLSQDFLDIANLVMYLAMEAQTKTGKPASEVSDTVADLVKTIKNLSILLGAAQPRSVLFMAVMALLKSECIDFFACAPEEDFGEFMEWVREGLALWGDKVKQPESPTSDSLM